MRLKLLACAALALAACGSESKPPSPPPAEAEAPRRNVFLFLGDSLTAGYGISPEDAYPALLAERWLREGVPYRPRNAGVNGQTSAGVLENLDWDLAEDVHTLFLAIGANDGLRGHDLALTASNIDTIVERAQSKGIRVVIAGMKIPPNYGPDYTRKFSGLYSEIAKAKGIRLMPFLLEGVGGVPAYNLLDGVHPNEKGHRIIAKNVHTFLDGEGLLR